ncbi:MAG: SCO family protein [Acetobacteraceae bacterium]
MNKRRKVLTGLAGVVAAPALAGGAGHAADVLAGAPICTDAGPVLPVSADHNQFPELTVECHHGRQALLYADFVRDRVVVLDYMSIANEARFPVTARMAAIVRSLGARVGPDITVLSITTDPARDTPAALAAFARRFDAPSGWHFLRASLPDAQVLSRRLYRMERDLTQPFSVDLIHYGNAKVGVWGGFPATVLTEDAVSRILSVVPKPLPQGAPRRAGPRPLGSPGSPLNHLIPRQI